jgi:tetratricopeptide (TPR) repeat protein
VTPTVPAHLPPDVAGFAGRGHEIARLDAVLDDAGRAAAAPVIVAISGSAGVGKTCLAVHWAHRVRDRFPDGQLYVNLRGFSPSGPATAPADAVRGFLDALGVAPRQVPATVDAQAGLFRSLLADRRMVVLLDNARDAEQVRPLLPGSPGCLALVTSRSHLPALVATEGAHPVPLDLLTADEARDVLARRLGPDRIAGEPEATDGIIDSCARLPLALAVVAARAATHPHFPLATLAAELGDAHSGLGAFANTDPAIDVRSVFSWSYRQLTPAAARLFRLIGLHPGPDIGAATAASLAGSPLPEVRRLLAELAEVHLLSEHAPARYTFHDLLRAYAAELADAHDAEPERRIALNRMLDHYLHSAFAATMLLHPDHEPVTLDRPRPGVTPDRPADPHQALTWLTTEHADLIAAIDEATRTGFDRHVWPLAWTVSLYLQNAGHWQDRVATQRAALTAATRLADRAGQAHAHRGIAQAYSRLGRDDEARTHFRHALDLCGDDPQVRAHIHLDLARLAEIRGRHGEALDESRFALDLYRAVGSISGQARALNAVGWCHAQLGRYEEALADCEQALALQRELGDRTGQADTWDSIGYAHRRLGRYDRAIDCYRHALDLWRGLGSRNHEAETRTHLGDAHDAAGDHDAARTQWQQALEILDEIGHPDADRLRAKTALRR